ncbi:MAG TPA: beta-ketoacyl-ACP synthase III [Myxococcota bacterium]|nr:beta-ketoacyl-ACP synthase III [Myxococcota bacterium]
MERSALTGTGLWVPAASISNEELVASHRAAVARWNDEHAGEIAAGRAEARDPSSEAFIVKASGIQRRYVVEKEGVLDPARLRPHLPLRGEDQLSVQAEICAAAAREALARAGREPRDVDAVIVACSNLQRPYPAVAIEVQQALGARGFAFDLNVACSSATFGLQTAANAVACGHARRALVLSPELTSGHNNFALREFHFIFGDACTAALVEPLADARPGAFEIVSTRLQTRFSNHIRNDFGFLNRCEDGERDPAELVFRQNGRQVFREVCPLVSEQILGHLADEGLAPSDLRRLWLHQANLGMNELIARTVLGRDPKPGEAPVILDEFANTSSAGSVIAFHRFHEDLAAGDLGVLCSFGAGYSIGSVLLRRL